MFKQSSTKWLLKKQQIDAFYANATLPILDTDMREGLTPNKDDNDTKTKNKEDNKNDTKKINPNDLQWIIKSVLELVGVFASYWFGYNLYYFFTAYDWDSGKETKTGIYIIDWLFQFILRIPGVVSKPFASNYGGAKSILSSYPQILFTLLLLFVLATEFIFGETIYNAFVSATKFSSSPYIHVLLAWIWSSSLFEWMTMFHLVISPMFTVISLLLVIIFTHLLAPLAQLMVISFFVAILSGMATFVCNGTSTWGVIKTIMSDIHNYKIPDTKTDKNFLSALQYNLVGPIFPYIFVIIMLIFLVMKNIDAYAQLTNGPLKIVVMGCDSLAIFATLVALYVQTQSNINSNNPAVLLLNPHNTQIE